PRALADPVEPPFCGTDRISKGPWVASVDGTTAIVRWETCVPGPTSLSLTPEAGGDARTVEGTTSSHEVLTKVKAILPDRGADLPGTWFLHEARLDSLAPSTCYAYQAAGEAGGRFCTARSPGQDLRFAFIADTNPGLAIESISKLFTTVADFRPDLTLHGGDMQYYSSGLEPYAWWFGATAPLLRSGVMWPAVGNHESEKTDEFTDYYERFWGGIGRDNVGHSYHFDSAGVHFFSLNTEESLETGSPQFTWASQQLAAATTQPGYRFSVVFFHRPLATCGDSDELEAARPALQPLFKASHVRLVLNGHMHGYERFDLDGTSCIVAGGGGGLIGDIDANAQRPLCGQRQAHGAFTHVVTFELTGTTLTGKAIDAKGETRDTFTLTVP
ncbi:MAG: hypothetical protein EOO75_15735, partial [Myxococcales bacterium]